jgi:hypothetical protein
VPSPLPFAFPSSHLANVCPFAQAHTFPSYTSVFVPRPTALRRWIGMLPRHLWELGSKSPDASFVVLEVLRLYAVRCSSDELASVSCCLTTLCCFSISTHQLIPCSPPPPFALRHSCSPNSRPTFSSRKEQTAAKPQRALISASLPTSNDVLKACWASLSRWRRA